MVLNIKTKYVSEKVPEDFKMMHVVSSLFITFERLLENSCNHFFPVVMYSLNEFNRLFDHLKISSFIDVISFRIELKNKLNDYVL